MKSSSVRVGKVIKQYFTTRRHNFVFCWFDKRANVNHVSLSIFSKSILKCFNDYVNALLITTAFN